MAVRIAALGAATMGLSACYYDAGVGLGYYDDGYSYYDDGYGCDPYSPFDSYYDCDYRGGFHNIGYAGGWYQDYWYPGYGFYIFDRGGRRFNMRDDHRRYWAGRRHEWYRDHHGRRDGHDGRGRHDDRRSYSGVNGTSGWPEQHGGRREDRRGHDGYRDRNDVGNNQSGIWRDDHRREGRRSDARGDGRGEGRRDWSRNDRGAVQPVPQTNSPQAQPPARGDGQGWRRGNSNAAPRAGGDGNRRNWQAQSRPQVQQGNAAPAPAAQPRMARPGGGEGPRGHRGNDRGPREE